MAWGSWAITGHIPHLSCVDKLRFFLMFGHNSCTRSFIGFFNAIEFKVKLVVLGLQCGMGSGEVRPDPILNEVRMHGSISF